MKQKFFIIHDNKKDNSNFEKQNSINENQIN
jgi:hypothetical protein